MRPLGREETILFDHRAKYAFVLVCLTLLGGSVGFRSAIHQLNVYLRKKPVELRDHFDNISTTLGHWQVTGTGEKLTAEMVEELGTSLYLNREYSLEGNRRNGSMSVHIAYYTGIIDPVPHVPDRCLVAAGFNARTRPDNMPMTIDREGWLTDPDHVNRAKKVPYELVTYRDHLFGRPVTVRMPVGDFALRVTEFSHDEEPDARIFGGYLFIANGRTTPTPEGVKRLAFEKSEEHAYYCKVQFLTVGREAMTAAGFVDMASDLLSELLPELMRCLPDWAEVEGAGSSSVPNRTL